MVLPVVLTGIFLLEFIPKGFLDIWWHLAAVYPRKIRERVEGEIIYENSEYVLAKVE